MFANHWICQKYIDVRLHIYVLNTSNCLYYNPKFESCIPKKKRNVNIWLLNPIYVKKIEQFLWLFYKKNIISKYFTC